MKTGDASGHIVLGMLRDKPCLTGKLDFVFCPIANLFFFNEFGSTQKAALSIILSIA